MNKQEPKGVLQDIVDNGEDVIEVEGMEVLVDMKEVKGKDMECCGCRVNIAVG